MSSVGRCLVVESEWARSDGGDRVEGGLYVGENCNQLEYPGTGGTYTGTGVPVFSTDTGAGYAVPIPVPGTQ